ncbi:MAG: hypothetical protein J6S71_08290 [Clostridia bacterium]|nr:hypothetical protein [Clostridia bacterium]
MTVRKALSAFLALTILISSVLFSYPLGVSAEEENRVTAQTDAAVTQGDYGYCYVYIDDASMLASLSVSVYYDAEKIEAADSYNQIACSFYDSSSTDGCIQYTYLFQGEGSSSKTALFYFSYRVKDDAAIGDTFFDIVINEAYDSALNIVPVSGSRTNFTVKEKKQILNCYVYGNSYVYSSINNEFTVSYSLSTNEIAAGSVLIQYNSELFEVTDVNAGDFFDNKSVDINSNLIGAVFVSFSGTEYGSSTQFLNINFKVIKNTDEQSAIKMTVVELYDLERNKIIGSSTETSVFLILDPSYKGDAPSMSVSTQYVEPGIIVATVALEKDSHLGAGDFVLKFDPSVLEYASLYKGLSPDYFIINEKNIASGELKFSIISLADITEASNVLVVIFNVKHACKGATTALEISGSQLSDSLTNPIVLNFRGTNTVIPPTDTYGDWKVDIAPKCESIGYESRFCTICNNIQVREIPALGHDMKPTQAINPTCTTPGATAGEKCSRCERTTGAIIPALKHDLTQVPAKAPTCTEIGWNAYEKCSRCSYTTYSEIPALKHDLTQVPAKAPTCTEIGWNAYEKCSRCSYTTYVEIPALNHDLTQVPAKAATCTEIGWNAYEKCSRCSYTTYVELPALKHDLTQVPAKTPTCTEIGWNAYEKCSRCSYTTYAEIPALKHDLTQVLAKTPTCTEIGWNAYEKCSRCSYTTYVELSRVEHKYTSQVVKPQFGVQGYTLYTCSVCGYSYKDNYTDALTYIPGDIDGTGAIDATDAGMILKYITGHDVSVVEAALDFNGDGKVNIRDAATILLYLDGKDVALN